MQRNQICNLFYSSEDKDPVALRWRLPRCLNFDTLTFILNEVCRPLFPHLPSECLSISVWTLSLIIVLFIILLYFCQTSGLAFESRIQKASCRLSDWTVNSFWTVSVDWFPFLLIPFCYFLYFLKYIKSYLNVFQFCMDHVRKQQERTFRVWTEKTFFVI